MVKKQDSPRQLHVLREVKRKAQVDQEARLQQTLLRISQQEAQVSTSTQRTKGSTSTSTTPTFYKYYAVRRGRVCNVIYSTWVKSKYINSLWQSISPSQLTVRLRFISQLGLITARVFLDRLITIVGHQSQLLTLTRNQKLPHPQKLNRNKLR